MLFVVTASAGNDTSNSANPHTHERTGILHLPFAEENNVRNDTRLEGKMHGAGGPERRRDGQDFGGGGGATGLALARERQSLRSWDAWRMRWVMARSE